MDSYQKFNIIRVFLKSYSLSLIWKIFYYAYVDIDDIKRYFKDYNFLKIPIEETEYYNIENTEYFSKHFKLIISKNRYG